MTTFAQAVYNGAKEHAMSEVGKQELAGYNRDQVVAVVKAIATALDALPSETSMHVTLFGITYFRNALIMALKYNEEVLARAEGGAPS